MTAKPLDPSDPRCGGNGGLDVSTETGAEVGVVCNGTPGAPGAKGDTGPPGSNGGLVGSPCTIPGGTAGTVQMNVAADGTISFACQPSGGGNCSAPNATATCDVNGNVVSLACNDGYADADGILANGCEANLMTDAKNCGSVGNAIPADGLNNATYACVAGKAVITSCSSGFADANNLVADGCEVNLLTDPKNCGSVGTAVPPDGTANANYACVSGKVVITSCLSGFADANHIVGDGCEVNLMVDPANCGSVGNAIPPDGTQHAHYACIGGQVKITGCVSGWFDADGSPVDGCEWQVDQFEPNDTQGSATNFGAFPIGAGFTASPNLTPGNEDWFKFTSTGCLPLFNPCSTKITVTGQTGPVGVTIVRDDGLIVGNGAADSSGANASQTYFVRVFNTTAPFVHYQVNYTNN